MYKRQVYDPELVGYGADWWFLHTLGADIQDRVAVIDEVTCINPYDKKKGGVREIDTLQSHDARKEVWDRMKARHGLSEQGRVHREFRRVNQGPLSAAASVVRLIPDWVHFHAKGLARRLLRGTRGQQ